MSIFILSNVIDLVRRLILIEKIINYEMFDFGQTSQIIHEVKFNLCFVQIRD